MRSSRSTLVRSIAFSSIVLFVSGCAQSPDLVTYRDGLHAVDEPLYQAQLLLMDDAVQAGIRTTDDQRVIEQGIAAARALYQQSVSAGAAAGAQPASTQP